MEPSPKEKAGSFHFGKYKYPKPRSKSLGAAALLQSGIEALTNRHRHREVDSDTEVESAGIHSFPKNRPDSFK